jgi:hypothetical protein
MFDLMPNIGQSSGAFSHMAPGWMAAVAALCCAARHPGRIFFQALARVSRRPDLAPTADCIDYGA